MLGGPWHGRLLLVDSPVPHLDAVTAIADGYRTEHYRLGEYLLGRRKYWVYLWKGITERAAMEHYNIPHMLTDKGCDYEL